MGMNPNSQPLCRLIVCADDYALSPAVSLGIRQLAEQGRISATGAMTCMPSWAAEALSLAELSRSLDDRLEVGLHLTLTDQEPLTEMSVLAPEGRMPTVGTLIKAAVVGMLPLSEIALELNAQLTAFEARFGRLPDFIDGHQHVHLLPGIRQVVFGLFHHRLDPAQCWLRDCSERPLTLLRRGGAVKAAVVMTLAKGFTKTARARGITVNRGFTGFYDPASAPLGDRLASMLRGVRDGSLLMIHPGHVDATLEAVDSLTGPRQVEWDFLSSDAWPKLLEQQGLTLARKGDLFSSPSP